MARKSRSRAKETLMLATWTCDGSVMVRNDETGDVRELNGVRAIEFTNGVRFEAPQKRAAEEQEGKFVQTLAGPVRLRG